MNRFEHIAERVVANVDGSSPTINGMSKPQAVKLVNSLLSKHTKGFFSDDSWVPVNAIWNTLSSWGFDWDMTGNQYLHNEQGVPNGKTWKFTIKFENNNRREMTLYGIVTASGAGTVADPLSRYDLVAYVS